MESQLIDAISSVGVPAVISFYLLVRVQNSLDRLTEAINRIDLRLSSDTHHGHTTN